MSIVLVIGSGGREHAICAALAKSPSVSAVLVAPGNAATAKGVKKVTNITLNVKDHQTVISQCKNNGVDVVVVGPEDPLADGLADSLNAADIKVFGPSKRAAQVESSKAWAKDFMKRHGIPTARYHTFSDPQKAKEFIQSESWPGYVIKASGLAAGKGVIVTTSKVDAVQAVDTVNQSFGAAGDTLVIEELLQGEEVSVLCFTDGTSIAVMPPAQDHKRLHEGDLGPNTGGMGAYCPCPIVTSSRMKSMEDIVRKAVDGLRAEDTPFVGVLYAGFMLTPSGPQVLEFNCRFGDPETQVLLPLLRTDFYEVVKCCVESSLSSLKVEFDETNSCVAVCVVSGGYPGSYPKGKKITGIKEVCEEAGVRIYQAGTKMENGVLCTSGGRVLAVTVIDSTLASAAAKATAAASNVLFDGSFFRKDIAAKAINRSNMGLEVTYKSSGVDIAAGDALVSAIKEVASSTSRPGVMGGLGSFGGIFDVSAAGYKDPLLISGTDGVGTKLKVAQVAGIHGTVGQDLVAMCVNDVLVHGAEPLYFLDYFATGRLEVGVAASVVKGVAEGCLQAGCALIGGETAEMPGMYAPGEYDLAGFTVGAVERENLLPLKDSIIAGDVLLGLESSGLHSNGFSLVRRIVEANDLKYDDPAPFCPSNSLGAELLKPTRIYVKSILAALQSGLVKAAAHITGGGLSENLPRVLPDQLAAKLRAKTWNVQSVFHWLAAHGVSSKEMARTFNCGIGMIMIVSASNMNRVQQLISNGQAKVIGEVVPYQSGSPRVLVEGLEEALNQGATKLKASSPALRIQRKRVAVLISGSGTNLQALLDHTRSGLSAAEIVLVISNVPGVHGLQRAHEAGVPTQVIPHKNYKNRQEFDTALTEALKASNVELVCLAGFMRILTSAFVNAWNGRLLNVHPSILPAFKGMHAQRQALEGGVAITGCTVHFVAVEVDGGAIVTQESVPVLPGDTEDLLSERIKTAEHRAYPRAMELVARGRVKLDNDGRRCIKL